MSVLSDDQFRAQVIDEEGEASQTFSTKTHLRALVSIGNVREGDLFRHTWQHEYPYQKASGAAIPDPQYPKAGHVVIPVPRSFTPHLHEDTKLKVIRKRSKPRE